MSVELSNGGAAPMETKNKSISVSDKLLDDKNGTISSEEEAASKVVSNVNTVVEVGVVKQYFYFFLPQQKLKLLYLF